MIKEAVEREWAIRHLVDAADALNGILVDPLARRMLTAEDRKALVATETACSKAAQILVNQRVSALEAER